MKRLTLSMLAAILAGCSLSSPPTAAYVPGAPAAAETMLQPNVACPVPGRTVTKGGASVTLQLVAAYTGLPPRRVGTVLLFVKKPPAFKPIDFAARIFACGPPNGKKPIGMAKVARIGDIRRRCVNNVCTYEINYTIDYTPPAKLPGNKPWKYDLIMLAPAKPKPPFGPLPAFLVEVRKFGS